MQDRTLKEAAHMLSSKSTCNLPLHTPQCILPTLKDTKQIYHTPYPKGLQSEYEAQVDWHKSDGANGNVKWGGIKRCGGLVMAKMCRSGTLMVPTTVPNLLQGHTRARKRWEQGSSLWRDTSHHYKFAEGSRSMPPFWAHI